MLPIQSKTGTGLVRQTLATNQSQLHPLYKSAPQKPTVGQLLKNSSKDTINKTSTASSGFEVCEICGGYVKDKMSLRIHFFYAHKIDMPLSVFNRDLPPLICEVCKARYWTTQGLTKHKQATRHNAPATCKNIQIGSMCWICHQKRDNLYTHLVKFHRLSTGECMAMKRCMFCGHLENNRKALEIHMAAAHGVIIKAEAASNPAISSNNPAISSNNPAISSNYKQVGPQTVVVGPTKAVVNTTTKTKGGQGLVRNNFCVFCSTQFSDNTQLTLHCLGSHATCSSCGMVVAKQSDLARHVCRTMLNKTCPICNARNLRPNFYTKHLATHLKKCSVRVKRLNLKDIQQANVRVKDDVLSGIKRQTSKRQVQKSDVVMVKKIEIDNADDPIVLDSDDESKDSKATAKRKLSADKDDLETKKAEEKNENEPVFKKSKKEEEKSDDAGATDEVEGVGKTINTGKDKQTDKTNPSEKGIGEKTNTAERKEESKDSENTSKSKTTMDKVSGDGLKDNTDDSSDAQLASKKSSDDEKPNESNNDADYEEESSNASL